MDEKKNMRADVLGRRDALDAETRTRKSAAICRELERLVEEACAPDAGACGACAPDRNSAEADRLGPAHGVRAYRNLGRPPCVAVYAAMRSEVDLQAFAESAFARGWDVCFPCMVRDEADGQGPGRMAFYRVPGARLDHARAAFLNHPLRCLPCAALADAGYEVDIVEQRPTIGGRMAQLDKTFPTLDCAACILTPKMVEASQNEKINIISYAKVEKVSGFVGNFTATIRKKARFVDETKCTGCAACTTKCPSRKGKNEFNMGLNTRTAIYIPFAQAIPNVACIDPEQCIKLKTGKCGLCEKVCSAGAINYKQQDEMIERKYGAIVVATGFKPIDPSALNEFGYADNADVVTSLEFERLMNAAGPTKGTLLRPSDGTHPKTIVFIQCVGSRCDENTKRGKPYCSKICCMYTAKHAMLVREKYPDTDVHVFYIDVRTPGKNFDEFYRRAVEQYGVDYIKGMVGKVAGENGKLMVQGSDLINNRQVKIAADMVVLATAIEPDPTARSIGTMLTASMDTNDFFTEAHPKLRPVESPTAGIFLSGVAQGPKDIPETVAQAGAAASKVIGLLAKDHLVTNPCVAQSNELLCNGCSQCEKVCPYGAITYIDKEVRGPGVREVRRVAQVNPAVCQGCGACTVTCPSGAMDLKGFSNKQILAEVDAICRW